MFFDSRRSPVLAKNGMVATSQPLAAQAGLQMLINGGNAVDAAVAAAAAVLNVVEPESTGVGGDLFALIWLDREKQVRALNGSGRAPAAANIGQLRAAGYAQMPTDGVFSVSIPGAAHGWETILNALWHYAPGRRPAAGHPLRRGRLSRYRLHRLSVVGPAGTTGRLALGSGNAVERPAAAARGSDAAADLGPHPARHRRGRF